MKKCMEWLHFSTGARLNDVEVFAKLILYKITVLLYKTVYYEVFVHRYSIDFLSMKKCIE